MDDQEVARSRGKGGGRLLLFLTPKAELLDEHTVAVVTPDWKAVDAWIRGAKQRMRDEVQEVVEAVELLPLQTQVLAPRRLVSCLEVVNGGFILVGGAVGSGKSFFGVLAHDYVEGGDGRQPTSSPRWVPSTT